MSVIPSSQISLMRKRRELKRLMEDGQWKDVLDMEAELFTEINTAVNDPKRSSRDLLNELGSVIRVYRELSETCFYEQGFKKPES